MTTWAYGWQYPPGFLEFVQARILDVAHEPFGVLEPEHDYDSAHVVLSYQPSLFHEDPYWRDLVDAMAKELDVAHALLDRVLEAFYVAHAAEWGLRRWERMVGADVAPTGVSDGDRRAAVLARLRLGPRTVADFEALVESYFGLTGQVVEDYAGYAVEFNVYGAPSDEEQEAFERVLRELLPAHLAMTVNYGGFIVGVNVAGDVI